MESRQGIHSIFGGFVKNVFGSVKKYKWALLLLTVPKKGKHVLWNRKYKFQG